MPPLKTILPKILMHALLPFRPPHPLRLAVRLDTHHLLRYRQRRINHRRERVDQLRPTLIEDPQRAAAVGAEGPFGLELLFLGGAAAGDGVVFPGG